mmetsp:Transcript_22884/g.64821  ORF Transcript_22884/g.64821 Transcript_22884/m.64821 type:complete len:603 (-) Transcript_22884:79-1887(-)|eukprot:CAMPEP_0119546744 /NCGR_PEP_ID=MMETSP1352-20130426/1028_1 /TAXON_ID=265584 /ORGANISM="Stauroneis constricta, Strain CCMP1120" /LENGTH=602 /DNA_ID=CAMNT_0007591469 /DNA_START=418 /DNA_END=2226 /DNA_ORIENTATION=-
MDYDQQLQTIWLFCIIWTALSAAWIVHILIQIELNKSMLFDNKLELTEDTADAKDATSSTSSTAKTVESGHEAMPPDEVDADENKVTPIRRRRVSRSFKVMQIATVSCLVFINYLLLVMTSAPVWLSTVGMTMVLAMFLRFQIGEELRRQRLDRLMLILTLFLWIAGLLSLATYATKTSRKGEIYEGPARIIGYDQSTYENSHNDPVTRTNIDVEFGSWWACPLSGGKLCSGTVQGVLCQASQTDEETEEFDDGDDNIRRQLASSSSNAKNNSTTSSNKKTSTTASTTAATTTAANLQQENQDLETQNEELEKENEALQEELNELQTEEQEESEEVDEVLDEEEALEDQVYDEEEGEAEVIEEEEEESIEEEEETIEEWEQEDVDYIESYDESMNVSESQEETDVEDIEEEYDEYEDEVVEEVEEEYEDEEFAEDAEEEDEEYEEYNEQEYNDNNNEEFSDDAYEWEYGDYTSYYYGDDMFTDDYWDYDWDSAWGEYGCEDLFATDVDGQDHDSSVKAGEDEWPTINVYGSCKTCEAYILDYFAKEAFEETQFYKTQAFLHFAAAAIAAGVTVLSYIKHRTLPTADNEIELLSTDGSEGVLA